MIKEPAVYVLYKESTDSFNEIKEWLVSIHEETEDPEVVTDEEVWAEISMRDNDAWDMIKEDLSEYCDTKRSYLIVHGTSGTWRGNLPGGKVVNTFDEALESMSGCDIEIQEDSTGELTLIGSHHDGTNYYNVRFLTKKGIDWYEHHNWTSDREAIEHLWNTRCYTKRFGYLKRK